MTQELHASIQVSHTRCTSGSPLRGQPPSNLVLLAPINKRTFYSTQGLRDLGCRRDAVNLFNNKSPDKAINMPKHQQTYASRQTDRQTPANKQTPIAYVHRTKITPRPRSGAHYPQRTSVRQTPRTSQGNHEISGPERERVPNVRHRKGVSMFRNVTLQQRQIGLAVDRLYLALLSFFTGGGRGGEGYHGDDDNNKFTRFGRWEEERGCEEDGIG